MKHMLTRLSALAVATLLALVAFTAPVGATYQQVLSNTTLNGAVTSTATSLVLTSASASTGSSFGAPAVGQCLYVDHELMTITAVSSTTMTVRRDVAGRVGHATLAVVFTGACSAFFKVDPPVGTCTQATFTGPWINVISGNIWLCDTDGQNPRVVNTQAVTYNSVRVAP